MDRCALFVDAGYALADGAMAVHGTRRRDSVSWDHAGLLKLLAGLARDRTGLPVLRCYWYEAADGGRTVEHDALAEMPGLKLRLVNTRPGRREGIESQLRRDIVTLAKSGAIADAFIASADEHLAEIVAEVQDLGLRVVVLHIASDGGWTIPQPLRQECDDIVEISGVHLRPFVDLVRGAEPSTPEEHYASSSYGSRSHGDDGSMAAAMSNSGLPAQALAAPVGAYQVPAASDYGAAGYGSAQPYANGWSGPVRCRGLRAGRPVCRRGAAGWRTAAWRTAAAGGQQGSGRREGGGQQERRAARAAGSRAAGSEQRAQARRPAERNLRPADRHRLWRGSGISQRPGSGRGIGAGQRRRPARNECSTAACVPREQFAATRRDSGPVAACRACPSAAHRSTRCPTMASTPRPGPVPRSTRLTRPAHRSRHTRQPARPPTARS